MAKESKNSRQPILRGRHAKQVPVHESGLVNFDQLEMYFHPNPLHVPLYKTRGWKYHHALHPEASFKQTNLPLTDRDPRLVALRNNSYLQVQMRVGSERVYHLAHDTHVPHPVSEAIDKSLRDFEKVDMIGAASLYLCLARGSSQYRIDEGSFSPPWAEDVSLKDRMDFIAEVRDEHARSLAKAEIVPDRLITSALKRLSMHLDDPYVVNLADRRLASDPIFYPVRPPAHKTLLDKANRLLALEFMSRPTLFQTEGDDPNKQILEDERLVA